jgi:hypothetical protein
MVTGSGSPGIDFYGKKLLKYGLNGGLEIFI